MSRLHQVLFIVLIWAVLATGVMLRVNSQSTTIQEAVCQHACIGFGDFEVDNVKQCWCLKIERTFKPTQEGGTFEDGENIKALLLPRRQRISLRD